MATRDLGPFLPPATPVKLGEVSLERVTRLLLGLLGQVERLEQEVGEIKEAGIETRTNIENISQAVDVVKDGLRSLQLHGPRTPETKPPVWALLLARATKGASQLCPTSPPEGHTPASPFSHSISASPIPIGASAPPPLAPAATYPAPVKVDHPDAYTGKIGSEAKQWLTRMLAWTRLNSRMFPTDQEVLSFLLMNMKDAAGAWAHPHLDQLGSHRAIIQTVEGFKSEFLAAFGDPDATRAAERKITTLTQSGTCADYITNLPAASTGRSAAKLPLANTAPEHSLSCKTQHLLLTTLSVKSVLATRRGIVSLASNPTPQGERVPANQAPVQRNSPNPNFVSEEERNRRRAAGACIKCSKMGHKFAECRTGWKATPIEDKGKAKETAKVGKESGPELGKD
ncbi:Retrotransposon gag protein [Rhizoctonia solani]|uniref:Retrotransposon gag protein n=1 Tax=Rhizoctonia solani TaxID=456999 RepID=A0A8H7M325_9AGAM|nr:Retrotransposon gag protein [Rhizoctonia solani]